MDSLIKTLNDFTPVIIVIGLAFFMTVERLIPYFEHGGFRKKQRLRNLGMIAIAFVLNALVGATIAGALMWSEQHEVGLLYHLPVPTVVTTIIGIFFVDLNSYVLHRFLHKVPFLWRIHQEVPPKGYIGIFNRSQYEDVLITRVHGLVPKKVVRQRFNQINEFEELLVENGTAIIKLFLHISKDEQKERLTERIGDPEKRWKFSEGDLEERKLWDEYMAAFEDLMAATSTERAPWYIVPANRKWYWNLVVAELVVHALAAMKLSTPPAPVGVDFDRLTIR